MPELTVDVISPEKPLYSGKADSVVARAFDGEVGILSGHAPMLTKLGTGQVVITSGSTATTNWSRGSGRRWPSRWLR